MLIDLNSLGLQTWHWQEGEGRCQVNLTLTDTGNGLQGLLIGGEKPHVGGVVMALPRKSLTGEGWSTDTFITPIPGHKDVDVARTLADVLARDLEVPVVITAGIHSDNLSPSELKQILQNCNIATEEALSFFKS